MGLHVNARGTEFVLLNREKLLHYIASFEMACAGRTFGQGLQPEALGAVPRHLVACNSMRQAYRSTARAVCTSWAYAAAQNMRPATPALQEKAGRTHLHLTNQQALLLRQCTPNHQRFIFTYTIIITTTRHQKAAARYLWKRPNPAYCLVYRSSGSLQANNQQVALG